MLTIVRAGLRGTALGAVSYPSVDAETTPEGYRATSVRVRRLVVRRRYELYTRKVRPPEPRSGAARAALSKRDDAAAAGPLA